MTRRDAGSLGARKSTKRGVAIVLSLDVRGEPIGQRRY
jgi:hypothetical protein